MKKLKYKNKLLACLILMVSVCNAKEFRCVEVRTSEFQKGLNTYFNKYTVYEIPLAEISNYINQGGAKTNFNLLIGSDQFSLALELNDMRGKDYKAVMMTEHGEVEMPQTFSNNYKGISDGRNENVVRLTVDDSTFEGYITKNGKHLFFEPLKTFVTNVAANYYVVYDESDVRPNNNFSCGATELQKVKQQLNNNNHNALNKLTGSCHFVEIATEADYEYYQSSGSAAAALNNIRTILNEVEGLYTVAFNVKFLIAYQQIWTNVVDPYSGTTVQTLKAEFKSWWDSNRSGIDRDVTHMFTDQTLTNNNNGLATLNAVCSTGDYYSIVKKSSGSLGINLSAHELGHNFGATHDASCSPAYIMCPAAPSTTTGWSPQSLVEIPTFIAGTSCMEETFPFNTVAYSPGLPFSYIKVLGINSITINSGLGPLAISSNGFGYFESGNEIVISPTGFNTTGFIANTGSAVLMRISDLSGNCETLSKESIETVHQNRMNELIVAPNPATDKLKLSLDAQIEMCEVFDAMGQLVLKPSINENEIDVSQLKPGLYLINVISNGEKFNSRFVKM